MGNGGGVSGLIDIDFTNIEKVKQHFDPADVSRALLRTVNGIASKSKTKVSVEVRKTYNVKAGKINSSFTLRRANKVSPDAVLKYLGPKIGLSNFGARTRNVTVTATSSKGNKFKTKRKQTRVRVRKSSGLKVATARENKGFIAEGKSGNTQIFARKKDSEKLIALKGPSVAEMVDDKNVIDIANALIGRDFSKDFEGNMKFFLGKKVGLF